MINSLSYRWVPTKKGIPVLKEIDLCDQHLKHWEKIPGSEDQKKELVRVYKKKWSELTEDQRTGINNHSFKFTTAQVCALKIPAPADKYDYIYQDHLGTFVIEYTGQQYQLTFNGAELIRSPAYLQDKPKKQIIWLKHFAQYLIDEPDALNEMITPKPVHECPLPAITIQACKMYPFTIGPVPAGYLPHLRCTIQEAPV